MRNTKNRGVLWRVLFIIAALVMLTVLELGKHTLIGWALAVAAMVLFYCLRARRLSRAGKIGRAHV